MEAASCSTHARASGSAHVGVLGVLVVVVRYQERPPSVLQAYHRVRRVRELRWDAHLRKGAPIAAHIERQAAALRRLSFLLHLFAMDVIVADVWVHKEDLQRVGASMLTNACKG